MGTGLMTADPQMLTYRVRLQSASKVSASGIVLTFASAYAIPPSLPVSGQRTIDIDTSFYFYRAMGLFSVPPTAEIDLALQLSWSTFSYVLVTARTSPTIPRSKSAMRRSITLHMSMSIIDRVHRKHPSRGSEFQIPRMTTGSVPYSGGVSLSRREVERSISFSSSRRPGPVDKDEEGEGKGIGCFVSWGMLLCVGGSTGLVRISVQDVFLTFLFRVRGCEVVF